MLCGMQYTPLGTTGVFVSELCFGTMSFGGDADVQTSQQMFRRCRDEGINFFDCANVYAGGRSEEILGQLIAEDRNNLVIASKAHFPVGPAPTQRGSSRFHLVRAVEDSLRRQTQNLPPDASPQQTKAAQLRSLVEALNAVQVPAADVIAIIEELNKTGRLYGKLVVE